ncbi:MAG: hypothetical protein EBT48_03135, partial [Verrucomicrobia bacterium]|nr:hypothetical protein [Verrucomicrobiota bacterium]
MADLPEEDNPNAFGDQEVETENIVQEPVAQQPQQPQVPQSEAFSPWEEYKNDPNYAGLSIAQKQNLFDEWQNYATQYLAQQGALETEEDIQYTKDYFTDLAKTENFRKPIFVAPDYGEQILQQATSGFEGVTAGAVGYASAIGLADTQAAANLIAEKYRNRRDMYINPDLRKFGEKEMGFFEAGATIITNPWDVAAPLLAQSMGSNAPSFVAGAGGAAIGAAIAGPPGAVTGGMIGGMALSGPVDAAATFNELTISEVIARGLDPANPKDVQTVLDDPKFKEDTV